MLIRHDERSWALLPAWPADDGLPVSRGAKALLLGLLVAVSLALPFAGFFAGRWWALAGSVCVY
jgi:hypothetical protein